MARQDDEAHKGNVGDGDRNKVDPVARPAVFPVERRGDNDGDERKAGDIGRPLIKPPLDEPVLNAAGKPERIGGGDQMQRAPGKIGAGTQNGECPALDVLPDGAGLYIPLPVAGTLAN